MSDSTEKIRRQIESAGELQSVVRSMKALAAASVGQYEKSVQALADYYHTVELALHACLRQIAPTINLPKQNKPKRMKVGAIVFGSDQGLVGQFNDVVVDFALGQLETLAAAAKDKALPVTSADIWAVGERVKARLVDRGQLPKRVFGLPTSVNGITPLIDNILKVEVEELHLFYNRPTSGASYTPVHQRLLPIDEKWEQNLLKLPWPTKMLPEVMGSSELNLRALISGYLFVSIFRACAESLASENESRLAAMQGADKNIQDMLETLNGKFHQLRQSSIDEELFDVVSGFEALS
jgi:F-type H+-transporting ATPase subunit gamma